MSVALAVEDLQDSPAQQSYAPQPVEKRRAPRRKVYETHWLTMSSVTADFSSFVVAKLINVSAGGFGVSTLEPVQPGHEYAVAGEIQVDNHWMEISGHARVVYCRRAKEGAYRVGLEASGIRCQGIAEPN
jgi:hypothetical protein